MMQLKEIKIILVFTFLTLSCSNRIQVGSETLILTDIVRNEITFNEKNKEEVYKLLNHENLLDDKDRWFYIDRKLYAERREILLDSSWMNSNRDDITIIWFSRNDSNRKLFEEYSPRCFKSEWMRRLKTEGLRIHGWCLMTNHIHLVISAKEGYNLSDILRDFKKYTAKAIIKDLESNKKESRRKWMLWMFKKAGKENPNNQTYQFWRQDNRPIEITSNQFYNQKMEYIHYNPVKEGFCFKPEDYPYSSALWYKEKKGLLTIDEVLI